MKRTQVPQDFRVASLGSFLIAAAVAVSGDATARADRASWWNEVPPSGGIASHIFPSWASLFSHRFNNPRR
jgi:hypothetical protein